MMGKGSSLFGGFTEMLKNPIEAVKFSADPAGLVMKSKNKKILAAQSVADPAGLGAQTSYKATLEQERIAKIKKGLEEKETNRTSLLNKKILKGNRYAL